MADVKIYQPQKNAMQSGKANTKVWVVEYLPQNTRFIDPIMGWTGNSDMDQELKLKFPTKEAAISYAERNKLTFELIATAKAKTRLQNYADKFK